MTDARPTGEDLYTEDNFDYIPGATVFYKVDNDEENSTCSLSNGLPSNPLDYLKSVQEEAKNCPNVVVAQFDKSKLNKNKQLPKSCLVKTTLPGSEHAPSKAWCNHQIKNFCATRQKLVSHLAQLKSTNKQSKRRPKLPVYPLPSWDDQENWRYFCLGNKLKPIDDETEESEEKEAVDEDVADDLSEALAQSGNQSKPMEAEEYPASSPEDGVVDLSTLEDGFQPQLRILLRMDARQIQLNLSYQVEWLKTYGFSPNQGRWIYALMVCLEKPLYPTVISTLRDLSRQCAQERLKANPATEEMNGLNLIICIVAKYFDQADLADPS